MKRVKFTCAVILFLAIGSGAENGLSEDDWPQWRGADRDGQSKETGLLDSWPEPSQFTRDGSLYRELRARAASCFASM
jgi:hypothetical protein